MIFFNGIIRLFELLIVLIGGVCFFVLFMSLLSGAGAPALAAAAAAMTGLVVIPYCMARMLRMAIFNGKSD
jgi:hypothetical protein